MSNLNTRLWTVKQFYGWVLVRMVTARGWKFNLSPKTKDVENAEVIKICRRSGDIFLGILLWFRQFDPKSLIALFYSFYFFFQPPNYFFYSSSKPPPCKLNSHIIIIRPGRSNYAWNRILNGNALYKYNLYYIIIYFNYN